MNAASPVTRAHRNARGRSDVARDFVRMAADGVFTRKAPSERRARVERFLREVTLDELNAALAL